MNAISEISLTSDLNLAREIERVAERFGKEESTICQYAFGQNRKYSRELEREKRNAQLVALLHKYEEKEEQRLAQVHS